jgi:hypothetical protein
MRKRTAPAAKREPQTRMALPPKRWPELGFNRVLKSLRNEGHRHRRAKERLICEEAQIVPQRSPQLRGGKTCLCRATHSVWPELRFASRPWAKA